MGLDGGLWGPSTGRTVSPWGLINPRRLLETVAVLLLLRSGVIGSEGGSVVSASVGFKDNISTYVALSGDLHVTYSLPVNVTLPPNIIVQLILFDVQKNATGSILETFNLPIVISRSGEFIYSCGKIDLPGFYKVRLLESLKAPALAETRLLTVVWPDLNMTMPLAHTALSGEILLYILEQNHIEHRHCKSAHENREYYVEIVRNVSGEGTEGTGESKQQIDKISITGLENLIGAELMFECPMFDQAGVYQAYIRFKDEPDPPVAASNEMQVTWSSAYMLSSLKATSIFPCKNNFKVQYGHATCQSAGGDKIRLYEQLKRAKGNVASPVDLKYVGERRIETTEGATSGFVTFECEIFQATSIGYCFKYLSYSGKGAIRIQKTICLPTIYTPGVDVDGEWGTWSAWSACSVSCGPGIRTRFRACDSPPPSGPGRYCDGKPSDSGTCESKCEDQDPRSADIDMDETCVCGCLLTRQQGNIVSPAAAACPSKGPTLIWQIQTDENRIVELDYIFYGSNFGNGQRGVRIRDGFSSDSALLAHISGSGSTEHRTIKSTQNKLLIEYYRVTAGPIPESMPVPDFKATYTTLIDKTDNATGIILNPEDEKSSSWSTIIIVCIIVGCVILFVLIALICHYRSIMGRRKLKKSQVGQAMHYRAASDSGKRTRGSRDEPVAYYSFGDPNSPADSPAKYYASMGHGSNYQFEGPHPESFQLGAHPWPYDPAQPHETGIDAASPYNPYQVYHQPHIYQRMDNRGVYSFPLIAEHQYPDYCPTGTLHQTYGRNEGYDNPYRSNDEVRQTKKSRHVKPKSSKSSEQCSTSPPTSPTSDLASSVCNSEVTPTATAAIAGSRTNPPRDGAPGGVVRAQQPDVVARPPVEGSELDQSNKTKPKASSPEARIELRDDLKPDGQSPEAANGSMSVASPPVDSSCASSVGKGQLFPDTTSLNTLSDMESQDGLEYDDYIPQLPGSYFNMDPQAYTLTWSKPTPYQNPKDQKNVARSHAAKQHGVAASSGKHGNAPPS